MSQFLSDFLHTLLYGSKITGFESIQMLEQIHTKFMKNILNMKNSTPNIMVYGEFGRFPLEIQAKVRMIKYSSKISTDKHSKISFKMYLVLLYLHRNHIYSCKWITCIENILQSIGLNYVWVNNHVNYVDWLCNEVKKRLQSQFLQKWYSDIDSSTKCVNYRNFKTEFITEKYITELQPKFYIPLARFRTINHRFPIEKKGRWENTERSSRVCTLCNYELLGDE